MAEPKSAIWISVKSALTSTLSGLISAWMIRNLCKCDKAANNCPKYDRTAGSEIPIPLPNFCKTSRKLYSMQGNTNNICPRYSSGVILLLPLVLLLLLDDVECDDVGSNNETIPGECRNF